MAEIDAPGFSVDPIQYSEIQQNTECRSPHTSHSVLQLWAQAKPRGAKSRKETGLNQIYLGQEAGARGQF